MWQRLRRHARELGLPFDDKASEWMGSRPTLPDYLPAIGRSSRRASLYYAFGHQHLGLTLAAVTGEQVAALVCNEPPAIAVEAFSIDRFK
jgi:D-amino-acid dehydrogenase